MASLATRAAPAAGAAGGILSQVSQKDASVLQRAFEYGMSKGNSFLNNIEALTRATREIIPGGKVHKIGQIGNSPIFGSAISKVGIAQVEGQTVLVKMVHGNPQILGPLP